MTTLGKITEQIYRLYNGGNPSADQEITQKEIELLVLQSVNRLLKIESMQVNLAMGDYFPPHAAIAQYDNITVTAISADYSKLTLPAQPISMPKGMGVWNITKRQAYDSLTLDDFENPFVPIQSGQMGLMSGVGHTSIKEVLLSNVIPYELRTNNEVLFYAPQTDVGSSVNMQLLIADPAKVGSTATLPIGGDQESQIIQEVLTLLGVATPAGDEVSDANKRQ